MNSIISYSKSFYIKNHKALTVLRLIVGVIFLLSSLGKFSNFTEFTLTIMRLLEFMDLSSIIISSLIIVTELYLGISLIMNDDTKFVSLIIIFIILFIFIPSSLYMSLNNIDCNCFGSISSLNTDNIVINSIKNIILLFIVIIIHINSDYTNNSKYINTIVVIIILLFTVSSYNIYFSNNNINLVEYVEIEELLINKDKYFIIDARDEDIYNRSHIPNSISLPYRGNATDLSKLDDIIIIGNENIITYCDSESCILSRLLAIKISSSYNIKTYELKGGYERWNQVYLK